MKENKKIIIIAFDMNPYMGSEAFVAFSWVKILAGRYNLIVYTDSKHKENLQSVNLKNVKFVYVDDKEKVIKYANKFGIYNIQYIIFMRKVKKLIQKILKNKHDIMLISCLTPAGIHSYNDIYKFGVPVMIGPVGGGIGIPKGFERYKTIIDRLKDLFYLFIKRNSKWKSYFVNSKKIIVGTDKMKEILPKEAHDKVIQIFDTCVDTDKFKPTNSNNSGIIKIIYVGRLEKFKGCIILLECFDALVKNGYKNIRLSIAGKGREKNRILNYISKHSLAGYVKVFENINYKEMPEFLNKHDIFCLPTLKEPGGTAILEGMACGLPIITSDAAGPSLSVGEDCGIKVKLNNYYDFKKGIYNAVEYMIQNNNERKIMGINARRRAVEEFSVNVIKEKVLGLYDEVLKT